MRQTKTWLYGPEGAEQVGGSLTTAFTNPVCELPLPPYAISTRTTATMVTHNATRTERDMHTPQVFAMMNAGSAALDLRWLLCRT
jgi:hypothetical protein